MQVTTYKGYHILCLFSLCFSFNALLLKTREKKKNKHKTMICGLIFPCHVIACMSRW